MDLDEIREPLDRVKEDLFIIQADLERSYNKLDNSIKYLESVFNV